MRRFLVPLLCVIIFFLFPLQVFIIGNDLGIGIQGAVYRFQVTSYGDSLITIGEEINYIIQGIYSGKTAFSVILWALGTVLLTITTWFGLIYADGNKPDYHRLVRLGLAGSCIIYLISCITQYGIFFNGPAGISLPVGIGIILIWMVWLTYFRNLSQVFKIRNG